MITENTAGIHKDGKYMKSRFADIMESAKKKEPKPEEHEPTAEEVIARIKGRLSGTM